MQISCRLALEALFVKTFDHWAVSRSSRDRTIDSFFILFRTDKKTSEQNKRDVLRFIFCINTNVHVFTYIYRYNLDVYVNQTIYKWWPLVSNVLECQIIHTRH